MTRSHWFLLSAFSALLLIIGCGPGGNGLATDSGDMTIEEYEELQRQSESGMAAMPKDANKVDKEGGN